MILNNGAFSFSRTANDIAVTGKTAPDFLGSDPARIRMAFRNNPVQQQRAQQWVDWARANGVNPRDIRINQTQLSGAGTRLGENRPDIQFTLAGGDTYTLPNGAVVSLPAGQDRRFYIELDTVGSNRGPGHFRRIIANDPGGFVVLETNNAGGIVGSFGAS